MAQNMENIDFDTIFTVTSQQWFLREVKLWFLSSLEHFWPDPSIGYFVQSCYMLWKNAQSLQK